LREEKEAAEDGPAAAAEAVADPRSSRTEAAGEPAEDKSAAYTTPPSKQATPAATAPAKKSSSKQVDPAPKVLPTKPSQPSASTAPTVAAIVAVSILLSLTALSWHGIVLSESARMAPAGMTGSVAGGVLSFGQMGALFGPLVYAGLLRSTGSYGIGFLACGVPSLIVGINLLRLREE
jgi:hypothetical protein